MVQDVTTGNILTSENDIVTDGWKDDPERFVPVKPKKAASASSSTDSKE